MTATSTQAPPTEKLTREEAIALTRHLAARLERLERRKLFTFYPDTGPFRRALYTKHMEFFEASKTYTEVGAIAGNRTGKTTMASFAVACHLTGYYPDWWPGRRWDRPIKCWAVGKTNESTRTIIQPRLFGQIGFRGTTKLLDGTGMVPGEWIGRVTWKSGTPDFVDMVRVRHKSGGWSHVQLKSYEQGRGAFEGEQIDLSWFDEEPPMDVYGEALIRLASTTGSFQDQGLMLCTFSPLEGLTEVVLSYMPTEMRPGEQ